MNYWDALYLPVDTPEQVAHKMTMLLEATNDFYKWEDPSDKNPLIRHLVRAIRTLAHDIELLKAKQA